MLVIPAIDMKDRQTVRLTQGRMADAIVYSNSVVDVAARWIDQGALRLHLVDLNGAFEGRPAHFQDIIAIVKKFPKVAIEVGGGIRELQTLQRYFDAGVRFCILGTAAIKNPELVHIACENYPGHIILGLDAKDGLVATEGWGEVSATPIAEVLKRFQSDALESVICTDISKDGMLAGFNLESVATVRDLGFRAIASGGLGALADLDSLKKLGGVYGVIAGKALYENIFTLSEAIARVSC